MMSKTQLEGWANAVRGAANFRLFGLTKSWQELADSMESCSGHGEELKAIAEKFVRLSENGFSNRQLDGMCRIFCRQLKYEIDIEDRRGWSELERVIDDKFK